MNHQEYHHHYKHPRSFLRDIEKLGDEYLVRKAPYQLPHSWKQAIAKILPVLTLIVAILAIPWIFGGALFLLGIAWGSAWAIWPYGSLAGALFPVAVVQLMVTLIIAILYFKAFDPLRKRQFTGWVYIFYACLLGFISNILDGGIIGALIVFVLSMYLLFQAKELYH